MRTKGEAGTGDVTEAVKHIRQINHEIRQAAGMSDEELYVYAKDLGVSYHLLKDTARKGHLSVVNFAAYVSLFITERYKELIGLDSGGIATPADAAMCMQLGCDGVFVGSGIFLGHNPEKRARAIVQAVTHYNVCSPYLLLLLEETCANSCVCRMRRYLLRLAQIWDLLWLVAQLRV